jgi:uncharacterized membrane protein
MGNKIQPKKNSPYIAPEYAFLAIGLLFGLILIYTNPPFQSNDEERHFYNSYFASTGQIAPRQNGDQVGGFLPTNLLNVTKSFQGIRFENAKLSQKNVNSIATTPLAPDDTTFYNNPNYSISPIPYLPFVVGIWISRAIDSNPISLLHGARFMGLVTFLVAVFFAIRIIPVHKYVLLVVALTPTTLFQASSVTYDTVSMAATFLMFALILSYVMRETELSNKELLLLVLLAVVQRFAKNGYFLVPFLFFLIPQKKIGPRWKSVVMFLCLAGTYFLPQITWDSFISSLHLHGGQAFQKDFYFDAGAQISFYKARPIELIKYLTLNGLAQGKAWIIGAIGRFGYSYVPLSLALVFLHGLILIAISVLDSKPDHQLLPIQKVITFCVFAGTAGVIIGGFFMNSPVGARLIFGLQGRYFLPVIPLLLLLNYNSSIRVDFWDKWKRFLVPGYAVLLLVYTVHFLDSYFWIA